MQNSCACFSLQFGHSHYGLHPLLSLSQDPTKRRTALDVFNFTDSRKVELPAVPPACKTVEHTECQRCLLLNRNIENAKDDKSRLDKQLNREKEFRQNHVIPEEVYNIIKSQMPTPLPPNFETYESYKQAFIDGYQEPVEDTDEEDTQ